MKDSLKVARLRLELFEAERQIPSDAADHATAAVITRCTDEQLRAIRLTCEGEVEKPMADRLRAELERRRIGRLRRNDRIEWVSAALVIAASGALMLWQLIKG